LEGFKIAKPEDVGDVYPRRVVYFPSIRLVRLKRLRALDVVESQHRARQTNYLSSLAKRPTMMWNVRVGMPQAMQSPRTSYA